MQKGHVAKLDINVLLLKHPAHKFENFEEEVQYIINHERRNKFIRNLALDLKGNTLILFSRVEGHGQPLFDMINNGRVDDRQVFFVHGGVATEDRERVREITEKENDAIIVASYGTFSTGINIKNLHNVIFCFSSKSRIRNLQSIGRVLRKGNNKTKATLYDIADDISYKSRKNYTLNHLIERIKVYNEENFNYDIVKHTAKKLMEEEFYAVIKLVSGEEIVSLVSRDDNDGDPVLILQSPIIMHMINNHRGSMVKIKPWMEVPDDDFLLLNLKKF